MTLPVKTKFDPGFPLTDSNGRPSQLFRDYLTKLDALVVAIASGNLPGLVNAPNDAAAAAAGVNVGQSYRNGNQLMVRVV